MRVLEFNVDQQRLKKDEGCDFSGIIAGTEGYLKAKFRFSEDWDGCMKVVSFWAVNPLFGDPVEYAVLLDENDICAIPADALLYEMFAISVIGAKKNYKITTNRIKINQEVN